MLAHLALSKSKMQYTSITILLRRQYPSSSSSLAFANHRHIRVHRRHYHKSSHLQLNRILFDTSEIDEGGPSSGGKESLATVTLPKDDYRTIHVAKILRLQSGDTLRAGSVRSPNDIDNELAGVVTDYATIQWLPEGKIKKAQPTKNGEPPGSLQISLPHPPLTTLFNATQTTQDIPPVSLLLALPRPLQLGRILPMISQFGVDHLVLCNAKKVPKDYFGSHIFRKPEVLRGMLVEGLAISGDVRLPNVTVTKRLKIFIEDELDVLFPREEYARVIAHPQRKGDVDERGELRMSDIKFPSLPKRILVAIG